MHTVVIDDEDIKRISLVDDLRDAGFDVRDFDSGDAALAYLESRYTDIVVTDLKMPGKSGLDVLHELRSKSPETDVILMTAYGTVESAVEAMRHGAYDYISKPFSSDELIVVLNRLREQRRLKRDNLALRVKDSSATDIVAVAPIMSALMSRVKPLASSEAHVLLTGETGSGKDVIARAIHDRSLRADRPFVKITCATYSEQLLESELFGHQRGAYTGADRVQPGRFELAHEGTVYLDDVDDIPLGVQAKLLRVIEERVVERVGDPRLISVNVRIVASTKHELNALVQASRFRSDLFHRLNVLNLTIPPLRSRPDDIEPLIRHFCAKGSVICACHFADDVIPVLRSYCWPGNVRELRNLVDRWKLLSHAGAISRADLPPEMLNFGHFRGDTRAVCPRTFEESVEALERRLLTDALRQSAGNKARAAEILKLKSSTFRNKLAKYDLNDETAGANSGA